jgi:four helix bundle protein
MAGFQDLIAWQKSVSLAEEVYFLTKLFPREEMFSLTSQMRRAAASIPANLAEGYRRGHPAERKQFTRVAFGSAGELESHLILSKKLKLAPECEFKNSEQLLSEVFRLLNGLCNSFHN